MENRSAPPGPIVPRLIYEDVARMIEWLCGAFGFSERLRTPAEPDGTIHHAQILAGEGSVVLTGQKRSAEGSEGKYVPSVMIYVDDVDAHCERARKYGARILMEPTTHMYGERQYSAEDPEQHCWVFSQSVQDVNPVDWGAEVKKVESRLARLARPRLCYLEIPATDVGASVAFYEKVFGWNVRGRDSGHPSFDDATGNISGSWTTSRPAREPGLMAYVWVDSIEETLARVAESGAEILTRPHLDSPQGEWIATFRDPAGNVIGLYQEH